jgi:hemerythrin-like domain-containing protein
MNTDNPFPSAAPDFSDPLGLLRACHERIFQHCDRLEALARHLAEKGTDEEALQAAASIYRYFTTAARHHHADEEEELFPLLTRLSPTLSDTVLRLEREHQQLDGLWTALAPQLAAPANIEDFASFEEKARLLAQAYRAHAQAENEGVLTAAQGLLSAEQLQIIGHNMAVRRGVTPPPGL